MTKSTERPVKAGQVNLVKADDLIFDRKNPRLAGYEITETTTDADIIKLLWDEMDVRELVFSMAEHGFFQYEPLIVAKEEEKLIVIEGNRRLAALRYILNPEIAEEIGGTPPDLSQDALNKLIYVPVVQSSREKIWHFLGLST